MLMSKMEEAKTLMLAQSRLVSCLRVTCPSPCDLPCRAVSYPYLLWSRQKLH